MEKNLEKNTHTHTHKITLHCKSTVKVKVAQSCPSVCDPMDCSLPGSSVHGILQARMLEWVAIPFYRESSQPRDRTQVSRIAARFFIIWAILQFNGEKKIEVSSACQHWPSTVIWKILFLTVITEGACRESAFLFPVVNSYSIPFGCYGAVSVALALLGPHPQCPLGGANNRQYFSSKFCLAQLVLDLEAKVIPLVFHSQEGASTGRLVGFYRKNFSQWGQNCCFSLQLISIVVCSRLENGCGELAETQFFSK